MQERIKTPGERRTYRYPYETLPPVVYGATITGASATATREDTGAAFNGLIHAAAYDAVTHIVDVTLTGGTVGVNYIVKTVITFSNGNIIEEFMKVRVTETGE